MTVNMDDIKLNMQQLMERTLEIAKDALNANEVPVGCLFIHNSTVIAESRNSVNETHNPTRHAEINCIDNTLLYCKRNGLAFENFFKNIIVYVTVEPCIMCAAALKILNVKKVIYGCNNDRFGGNTVLNVNNIYTDGYTQTGNILADEAMTLLKTFYKGTNPNAPEPKVKKKKSL
ncbi:tRNA-specific adenosine deaminase 2 [Leptidea sinapis]|uniref:tRNA-specific adenosine deaminase 2 n=1 Tax=Leptidea sinapis TaxID=189913 RepID=UPI00212D354B|nr:tRNA-specific adenosine deaminase 2 [Leptidea sinapis]